MALKKISIRIHDKDAGKRLDQLLVERCPESLGVPVSKAKVRKLIIAGAVYLNRKRVRIASKALLPNALVEAYIDVAQLLSDGPQQDQLFKMTTAHILYEDEFIIAVNKPPGLPTQPTVDSARANLFHIVRAFIAERENKPGAKIYLSLHHRLDRDTSGVIVMSKSERANVGLAEAFSGRQAKKIYNALVFTQKKLSPGSKWSVNNYLGKIKSTHSGKSSKMNQHGSVTSGGDPAHTDFEVLKKLGGVYLIEAQPKTGRTHQIRVHLSEGGLPILGDQTYGGAKVVGTIQVGRSMLHAAQLGLIHPVLKIPLKMVSPLPEDFLKCMAQAQGVSKFEVQQRR